MSRRIKPPCEYCEQGYNELMTLTSEDSDDLIMEMYPGNCISVYAYMRDESGELTEANISIPMNYCPVCGRKWEE